METTPPRSAEETAALDAFVKLMRAADSVSARAHSSLPRSLTATQFGVLEALFHLGPMCQRSLANKLLKTGGNITLVVDNLEKASYVVRERDPQDRRYVSVSLTEKGRALISELFPRVAQSITREFNRLTPAEQSELARLCKRLGLGCDEAQSP